MLAFSVVVTACAVVALQQVRAAELPIAAVESVSLNEEPLGEEVDPIEVLPGAEIEVVLSVNESAFGEETPNIEDLQGIAWALGDKAGESGTCLALEEGMVTGEEGEYLVSFSIRAPFTPGATLDFYVGLYDTDECGDWVSEEFLSYDGVIIVGALILTSPIEVETDENESVTILLEEVVVETIGAEDYNEGGDWILFLEGEDGPANGEVEFSEGAITYTPDEGFSGTDTFKFLVNVGATEDRDFDGEVEVTVIAAEEPPAPPTRRSGGRSSGSRVSSDTPAVSPAALAQLQTQLQALLAAYKTLTGQDFSAGDMPGTVRDLTMDMNGADVRQLQELLIAQNTGPMAVALAGVGATGYFGTYTRDALAEYQAAHSISPAAGYFGAATRAQMKTAGHAGLWW